MDNKIWGTKVISVLIICLCILTVFNKLTFYVVGFEKNQFISYVLTLCLVVVILYIIYVITNIIEYVILRIMKIIDIKYFVIYPFVFDKSIRFNPIKLIYNQECIRDVFVQNILFYYTHQTLDWIKKLFLKIKRIKEISLLTSLMIVAIFIWKVYGANVIVEVAILYTLMLLFSYCYFGNDWKGNRRVLMEDNFIEYILSGRYCKQIPSIEYTNFLYHLIDKNKSENDSIEVLLKVFENCLYSTICDDQITIPIKTIKEVITIIDSNQNKIDTLSIIKLLQIKKLIGLIGKRLNNQEYLEYGIELIKDNIFELSNGNIYGVANKAIDRLIEYQCFLNGEKKGINSKEHFTLGINNLFLSQIEVEDKIKEMLNSYC